MFERAFPFQHRPASVVIGRELAENGFKVDLSVAERAEAAGPIHPSLIASIDALFARGIEFGVLDMERLDALVLDVDEPDVVERLAPDVGGNVVDAAPPVAAEQSQGPLERCPIE